MPKIVVLDGRDVPNPQDLAMLMALYSRSPRTVTEHIEQVKKRGSAAFHERFYIGYGHKSIGDCGHIAMFFEGVSMLAAKAIQDTPLYSGQEASTRYMDMSTVEFLNPLGTERGTQIQDTWRELYTEAQERVREVLKLKHPCPDDIKPEVHQKAINARTFDICRALLPAGASTNVAWTTNLRQAHDHLEELRHHPLHEVEQLAIQMRSELMERYPSSFGQTLSDEQCQYLLDSMDQFAYWTPDCLKNRPYEFECVNLLAELDKDPKRRILLQTRPPRTELHQRFRMFGHLVFEFMLDFGSYRDLQRQRSSVQGMPLLRPEWGFHPWYLEQLPPAITASAQKSLNSVSKWLEREDPKTRQYYLPMGLQVPIVMSCTLPSAVYIAELRSGKTVHPTLRAVAQQMGEAIKQAVPGIAMHHDMSPDTWSDRRGSQDITEK